jgi:pilus assembly protein Flp/PilA
MYKSIAQFMKNEGGATAIEYALIAAATGLALIAVMPAIGVGVQNSLAQLAAAL